MVLYFVMISMEVKSVSKVATFGELNSFCKLYDENNRFIVTIGNIISKGHIKYLKNLKIWC